MDEATPKLGLCDYHQDKLYIYHMGSHAQSFYIPFTNKKQMNSDYISPEEVKRVLYKTYQWYSSATLQSVIILYVIVNI